MAVKQAEPNWNAFRRSEGLDLEAWTSFWTTHSQTRHTHESHQLSLTTSGTGSFLMRGQRVEVRPGDLILIPAGEVHALSPNRGHDWRFDTVYLPDSLMRNEGEAAGPTWLEPGLVAVPELSARFLRVHRAIVDGLSALTQETQLIDLLAALTAKAEGRGGSPPRQDPSKASLRRVRSYLESCPDEEEMSLSQLAELADLSPSHLSRAFRREFGLPPHAYLVQVRVSRAREYLKRGEPVCEVAARAGFADQAHLTRHFKRLVGVTPALYRGGSRIVQDLQFRAP